MTGEHGIGGGRADLGGAARLEARARKCAGGGNLARGFWATPVVFFCEQDLGRKKAPGVFLSG